MRRAILHIGTEKTGSTAIQAWLDQADGALAEASYRYCVAAGRPNNTRLSACARDPQIIDDVRMRQGLRTPADVVAFRTTFARALAREVETHAGKTIIFSSEHCHSRLTTIEEVQALHDLLQPLFDQVQVVVYLRRQDRVATSLYSTALRAGQTRASVLNPDQINTTFYDYDALLRRWSTVFGRERLTVRLFDRDVRRDFSVVQDFADLLGVVAVEPMARPNESLSRERQEFLRRMNAFIPLFVDGRPNPARGALQRYVKGGGQGRRPARADAQAFYAAFRDTNETVRRGWFLDRATLFDEDFSAYPETEDSAEITIDEAFAVMSEVWAQAARKNNVVIEKLRKTNKSSVPKSSVVRSGRSRTS